MCDVSEKTESSSHNIENGLDDTSLDSVEEERIYPKMGRVGKGKFYEPFCSFLTITSAETILKNEIIFVPVGHDLTL